MESRSGKAFAAAFSDTADFIAFEGTHLKGQKEIASFHQIIFDGPVKGSRLEGEVKFVRFLNPELAVMHSVVRVMLPGQSKSSPSRDSMQLFVVMKQNGNWIAEALQNSRVLTMERQFFLDDLDLLFPEEQRHVTDLLSQLKQKHS